MNLNQQPPEAYDRQSGSTVDLHSMFHTLQGEGPFSGMPAIFTRLAGCNLQCPFCDTEYTQGRHSMTMSAMIQKYAGLHLDHPRTKLVVITGGEPLRQDISPLINNIVNAFGWHVQIETNGVLGLSDRMVMHVMAGHLTVVCSPKTHKVHPTMHEFAACFKYVIDANHIDSRDGLPSWALNHKAGKQGVARPEKRDMPIFLSPCDEKDPVANARNVATARESCLHFGYRMQLQIHKELGLE